MNAPSVLNVRTDAPREIEELMKLPRSRLFVYGMNLGIFSSTADEQAFVGSKSEVQCQRIREELIRRDAEGWPDEGPPLPTTPTMPEPEQPQQPQENNMQPPQFQPVIPSTMSQSPGTQQQQQQAQAPAYPPQMPPQQMMPQMPTMGGMHMGGGMPQMPTLQQQQPPQAPMQAMPQMPTAQQAVMGLPQMRPPQWQAPAAPVATTVLPSGRAPAPAAPTGAPSTGLGEVLSKIAEVQAANQKMLEAIHRHQLEGNALMTKVLGLLLTTAQMQGAPMDALAQAMTQVGSEENVRNFLAATGVAPQGKA